MKICKWSICLALCLLLSACSPLPASQPPEKSILVLALATAQEGKLTAESVQTVSARDSYLCYTYTMENGVAYTRQERKDIPQRGTHTYRQYRRMLEAVLEKIPAQTGIGNVTYDETQNIEYNIHMSEEQAAQIKAKKKHTLETGNRYMGYYTYSLKTGALEQGEQTLGLQPTVPTKGCLMIWQRYTLAVDGGADETRTDVIYVFLED